MKNQTCALMTGLVRRIGRLFFMLLFSATGIGCTPDSDKSIQERPPVWIRHVIPGSDTPQISASFIDGNSAATCSALGYDIGFTVDSNGRGTRSYYFYKTANGYGVDLTCDNSKTYVFSVTASSDNGKSVSWGIPFLYTSDGTPIPVDVAGVIVKSDAGAMWYRYDPDIQGDAYLLLKLNLTQTIQATIDRTYDWDITATAAASELRLAAGQTYPLGVTVDVTKRAPTDVLSVKGTVTVRNPWPFDAVVTSIEDDLMNTVEVPLRCKIGDTPVVFAEGGNGPVTIGMNETIECGYSVKISENDDEGLFDFELQDIAGSATVVTDATSTVDGASAGISWPVVVKEHNACVQITASPPTVGILAENLCESDSFNFDYAYTSGSCNSTDVIKNTASLFSYDTGFTVRDSVEVNVMVPPC